MNENVKIRIEGRPDDVREVCRELRRLWWVLDESRQYPNRTNAGYVRCYVVIAKTLPPRGLSAALEPEPVEKAV